jgi:DHA2 family multidrug resistance protein
LLDQGNRLDWFSSLEMMLLGVATVSLLVAFVARGLLLGEGNIINLHLFRDANFTASALLMALLGSLFLALLILTPRLLIDLLGWEVLTAGMVIGSYGLAGITGAVTSSHLVARIGIRAVVVFACLMLASGWTLFSRINLEASPLQMAVPGMMIEFGMMLMFPLLSAQAFSGLPSRMRDEGSGLFNFTKALGFSFGTTFVTTLIYRGDQINWNVIGGNLNPIAPGYDYFLQSTGLTDLSPQAGADLGVLLASQSSILTMVQTMQTLAVLSVCAIPLVLLLRKRQ